MLFVFPESRVVRFWMKDTLISLDMIWLDESLEVLHVAASVPPCAADPCPQYVLEVNAGQVQLANIRAGDRAILTGSGSMN